MLCFTALENLNHRKSSLSYRREIINDIDSISLTTDDLLKLPADGSFSVTYIGPGHQTHKKSKKCTGKSSFLDNERKKNVQEPTIPVGKNNSVTSIYTNLNGKQCERLKTSKVVNKTNKHISEAPVYVAKKLPFKDSSEQSCKDSLAKNYPRWLTSQKSDLNISGITSLPDFKYPVWLHNQDLLPDTNSERIFKEDQNSPGQSYQAQRTSRFTNKLDCFEDSFGPSNSLSNDKELINGYECDCDQNKCQRENPLLPGQSKEPFSGNIFFIFSRARKICFL